MKKVRLYLFHLGQIFLIFNQKLLEVIINGIFYFLQKEEIILVTGYVNLVTWSNTHITINGPEVKFSYLPKVARFATLTNDSGIYCIQISLNQFAKLLEEMKMSTDGRAYFSENCYRTFYGLKVKEN